MATEQADAPKMTLDRSDGSATIELYRAALGPIRTDYYLRAFTRFDAAGKTRPGWNWVAALLTINWLIYRRLWGPALAYVGAVTATLLLVFGILPLAVTLPPEALWVLLGLAALMSVAIPGAWGDAWLYKACNQTMDRVYSASATQEEACATLRQQAVGRRRAGVQAGVNAVLALALAGLVLAWPDGDSLPLNSSRMEQARGQPATTGLAAVSAAAAEASQAAATASTPVPAASPPAPATAAATVAAASAPAAIASAPMVHASAPVTVASAPAAPAAAAPMAGAADTANAGKRIAQGAVQMAPAALPASAAAPAMAAPAASAALQPATASKPDSTAKAEKAGKTETASRAEASTKPEKTARQEKADKTERAAKGDKVAKADKPGKADAKAAKPEATASAASTASTAEKYLINVGLFADPNNARNAYTKLMDAGLPALSQPFTSSKGPRTRVRVGPYETRAEAETAAERIRALQLDAQIFKP